MQVKTIFGPPGTGKTHRLMDILEEELKQYAPEEIAYVSFTREGAYQGRDRAVKNYGFSKNQFPYFRTLHSMAFKGLSLNRMDVIGKKQYKEFSDKMGMKFTGYYTEDMRHDDDMYLFFLDLHKNNPKTAARYVSLLNTEKLSFVRANYGRYKEARGKIDYTDMIINFVKENKSVPVKVAFIDEAQDLTTLQWKMVWTAFRDCDKVYIAGDDDQAIYQWSGADVDYFLSIDSEMEILRHSWRVPNNLLYLPRSITSLISKRIDKKYDGIESHGLIAYVNTIEEIPIGDDGSWLVLSRNNYFLKEVEDLLRSKGVVYYKKGKLSVDKDKVKAINLFEQLRKTKMISDDNEYKLRTHLKDEINLAAPWYDNMKWPIDEIAYYRDIIVNKTDLDNCKIKIGTIHSAKGDEADNVVIISDITKSVKVNLDLNPDSEHRCFYVGVTRTKKNLYIVTQRTKHAYTALGV
jgi:DNA helicase II / ATP-dependent DNA helicase PcrA